MRSRSPPALGRRPPARDRDVTDVRDVRAPSPGVPGPSCAVTISRRSVLLSPRCARPPNVWEDNDDEELIQRKKQKKQFEKKQKKQVSDDGDREEAPEERAIQICSSEDREVSGALLHKKRSSQISFPMMLKVPHDSKCGTPYVDSITSKKARHKKGYIYIY